MRPIFLALAFTLAACSPNGTVKIPFIPEKTHTVTGGVWFRDNIVRGLKLYLCKREAIERYTVIQKKNQQEFDRERSDNNPDSLNKAIAQGYEIKVVKQTAEILQDPTLCIFKSSTDIDGKYSLTLSETERKGGYQYLYSEYHAHRDIQTSDLTGKEEPIWTNVLWISPLPADTGKLDLNGDNALHVIDSFPYPGWTKTAPKL